MRPFLLVLAFVPAMAAAQQEAIQRALIQRDQQSAEFAAQLRGQDVRALQNLNAIQLRDVGRVAPDLPAYERSRMAQDRELVLPPPVQRTLPKLDEPLPLPGGPGHVVEPIAAPSIGG